MSELNRMSSSKKKHCLKFMPEAFATGHQVTDRIVLVGVKV